MFFSSSKIIIFISKTTMQVVTITTGTLPKKHSIVETTWTPTTLPTILEKIRKNVGKPVRVLLNDDVTYIATLLVPQDTPLDGTVIATKAQEIIPDNLNKTSWDFKTLETASFTKNKEKIIIIAAIVQTFFDVFSHAIKKSGLQIEAIEPIAYALARFSQNYPEPIIIAHAATHSLFLFTYKGQLLQTDFFTTGTLDTQINDFLSICIKKFKLTPHKIIVSGISTVKSSEINGIRIEIEHLDPLISLAFKKDLQNKHSGSLNLQLSLNPLQNTSDAIPKEGQTTKMHLLLWILFFILATGASIGLLAYYFQYPPFSQELAKTENDLSKTAKKTPIPTKQETENSATAAASIDLSAYTITVLNGSQKSGLAKQLSDDLTAQGATITSSGNADTNTYTQTEIRYKSSVDKEYKLTLDKLIKNSYDNFIEKNAENDQTTDVLIIIGAQ